MKTTIDLPDDLLVAAKKMAAENRLTLREIFERGLAGKSSCHAVKVAADALDRCIG